jgi:hypothetical protein
MRALAVAVVALGACQPSLPAGYTCTRDPQCTRAGVGGFCETTGACSFPDPTCAGGRRYGDLGPPAYAGACVGASNGDMLGGDMSGGGSITRVGATLLPLGANGAVVTLPSPGLVGSGDLLLVCVYASDGMTRVMVPSGWSFHTELGGLSTNFHATWLYHVAGAAEPMSYDFPLTSTPNESSGGLVVYRGVAMPPIDAATSQTFGTGPSYDAPSITTTHANDELVGMFVDSTGSGFSLSPPSGMQAALSGPVVYMFDQVQTQIGATGDKVAGGHFGVAVGGVDYVALTPR